MHLSKIMVFILIVLCTSNVFSQQNTNSEKGAIEESKIMAAVESKYVKGLQIRDFELIKQICIPTTLLMGVNSKDEINITTLEKWSKRFDPQNPPFKRLDYNIAKIDIKGSAAQVKILFLIDSKTHVTDFLNMLKIGDQWKIVNIIDN